MLKNTAVFLVDERPPSLPASTYYPRQAFPFGEADPHGFVGETPLAWRLRDELAAAARTQDPVLITGESGSGKEHAATLLRDLSNLSGGPFIARNAATLPSTLMDAELFGTARDYPNAGMPQREGLIGAAHGGLLMLDEIGELPERHQAALLRVMDREGQYQRLGDATSRTSRFRLVGATNRDPSTLKHDFLARFTTRISIPGLDDRKADIPLIARELLRRIADKSPHVAARFFQDDTAQLDPLLIDALLRHSFKSHARELDRVLRLSVATSPGTYLTLTPKVAAELSNGLQPAEPEGSRPTIEVDAAQVAGALGETGGNISRAAALLGISRFKLHRLMRKHGLGDA